MDNILVDKLHGTGCIEDSIDTRDKEYDHLALGASNFDWETGFDIESYLGIKLPVKDQNGSYSCVGQSTASLAYIMDAIELKEIYGDDFQRHLKELSAKSIYSQISLGYNAGASNRDAVKLLCDYGINTEKEVPSYEKGKAPSEKFMTDKKWYSDVLGVNAKNYQGKEYRTLRCQTDINLYAQTIKDNKAVLIGFRGENNGTWHSKFPKVGKSIWGHSMLAGKAKLIDGKKYIGCLDSWGVKTGEDGWQWFGEEWFDGEHTFNPWFYTDIPNTALIQLLDRQGKPRFMSPLATKAIKYLIQLRGYKYA